MRLLTLIAYCLFGHLVFAQNSNLTQVKSIFGFEETVNIIKTDLQEQNILVFAVFNHQANAEKVQLKMNPSIVIVFGSPKAGTLLMQENQDISIELPLKISVIQNNKNEVWVSHFKIREIAKKYKLAHHPIITKIEQLLLSITEKIIIKKQKNYGNRN